MAVKTQNITIKKYNSRKAPVLQPHTIQVVMGWMKKQDCVSKDFYSRAMLRGKKTQWGTSKAVEFLGMQPVYRLGLLVWRHETLSRDPEKQMKLWKKQPFPPERAWAKQTHIQPDFVGEPPTHGSGNRAASDAAPYDRLGQQGREVVLSIWSYKSRQNVIIINQTGVLPGHQG